MGFLTLTLLVQLLWSLGDIPSAHSFAGTDGLPAIKFTNAHFGTANYFTPQAGEDPVYDRDQISLKSNSLLIRGNQSYRFYGLGLNNYTAPVTNEITIKFTRLLLSPFHGFT